MHEGEKWIQLLWDNSYVGWEMCRGVLGPYSF